jgi:hypothetical protein
MVAEGSLAMLQERYHEQDLEEIFIRAVGADREDAT